jgi:hypothetical protein
VSFVIGCVAGEVRGVHRSGFTFDADCHGLVVGATRCSFAHLARLQSCTMLVFRMYVVVFAGYSAAVHCCCTCVWSRFGVDAMASLVEAVDYDRGGLCRDPAGVTGYRRGSFNWF